MTLSQLFAQIEGPRFESNISILSGFRIFLIALQSDSILAELCNVLKASYDSQSRTLQRLLELLKANEQPEYAHPYDAAIAGYLYALNAANSEKTSYAIEAILDTPQLWWALRLAKHFKQQLEAVTPTSLYSIINDSSLETAPDSQRPQVVELSGQEDIKGKIILLSNAIDSETRLNEEKSRQNLNTGVRASVTSSARRERVI